MHLALCKYRQCLLTEGSMCNVPALLNSTLVFQKLTNPLAEIEARTLLLKVDMISIIKNSVLIVMDRHVMIWRPTNHSVPSFGEGITTFQRIVVSVSSSGKLCI